MVSSISSSLLAAAQSGSYTAKPVKRDGGDAAQTIAGPDPKRMAADKANSATGTKERFSIAAGGDPSLRVSVSKIDDKTKASLMSEQEALTSMSNLLDVLVKAFDVNADGAFDASDVEKLKNSGKASSADASGLTVDGLSTAIKSLLKTLDANGDGKIDQTDVNAVRDSGKAGAADRAKLLDSLLKALDVNRDGKLDSGDLDKLKSGGVAGAKAALKADDLSNALVNLLKFFDDNKDKKIDKPDVDVLKKQEIDAQSAAAKLQARMALLEKLHSSLESSGTGARAASSLATLLSSRHVALHSRHRAG